ncbi:Putative POM121-like protein 1 [Fukomys damarensis]|uniref:Putative POM121-like protein 1 n=2 Tax=Fukomys damarensis TaxID=885580 RepID=A0A091CYT2_FUKDA|nr:Putative POM121-like protein 1 [Fukomys damarensis]
MPSGQAEEKPGPSPEHKAWHWLVFFLCFCGFMVQMRPGESFITRYLLGPCKNFTQEQACGHGVLGDGQCWPEDKQKDAAAFAHLQGAMGTLGITEGEQRAIWRVLAAICHLGAAGACKDSRGPYPDQEVSPESAGAPCRQFSGPCSSSLSTELWLMEQQAQHRRGTGGPGTPPSAFEPAVGQRGPTAFVPRPGPLPRNLCGQRSRDEGDPGAQPSCASGLMRRNAVSCSYSSTGGLPGPGRGAATTRPRPLLGSSTNPEEKGVRDSRSAPEVSQETGNKKTADVTPGQAETRRDCVLTMEGAGPGIRKIPLLRRRRGDPLVLPSPPELSYQVTAEHTAREKEAALLRQQDADGAVSSDSVTVSDSDVVFSESFFSSDGYKLNTTGFMEKPPVLKFKSAPPVEEVSLLLAKRLMNQ